MTHGQLGHHVSYRHHSIWYINGVLDILPTQAFLVRRVEKLPREVEEQGSQHLEDGALGSAGGLHLATKRQEHYCTLNMLADAPWYRFGAISQTMCYKPGLFALLTCRSCRRS